MDDVPNKYSVCQDCAHYYDAHSLPGPCLQAKCPCANYLPATLDGAKYSPAKPEFLEQTPPPEEVGTYASGEQPHVGDYVSKAKGYQFSGTVQSVFWKRNGTTRLTVEMWREGVQDDMLHIFDPKQLTLVAVAGDHVIDEDGHCVTCETTGHDPKGAPDGAVSTKLTQVQYDALFGPPTLVQDAVTKAYAEALQIAVQAPVNYVVLDGTGKDVTTSWSDPSVDPLADIKAHLKSAKEDYYSSFKQGAPSLCTCDSTMATPKVCPVHG